VATLILQHKSGMSIDTHFTSITYTLKSTVKPFISVIDSKGMLKLWSYIVIYKSIVNLE